MSFTKELLEQLQVGPGMLVVIAAPRGGGKTYLATRIAGELGMNRATTYYSLELTKAAVRRRMDDMGLPEDLNCACVDLHVPPYTDESFIESAQKARGDFLVLDSLDLMGKNDVPPHTRLKRSGHALAKDALAEKRSWIVTVTARDDREGALAEVADVWLQPNWGTRCLNVMKSRYTRHGTTISMPNEWPMKNLRFPGV